MKGLVVFSTLGVRRNCVDEGNDDDGTVCDGIPIFVNLCMKMDLVFLPRYN